MSSLSSRHLDMIEGAISSAIIVATAVAGGVLAFSQGFIQSNSLE